MTFEFKLEKVDLFVSNADKMVKFYESVFDLKMKVATLGPYTFYLGNIPGFTAIQFVPEELSGITFEQNRHQFNFRVNDLNTVIHHALLHGGTQHDEIENSGKDRFFSITDPENNYIVFIGE